MPTVLDALDQEVARALIACAVPRSFERGDVVFREGDSGDSLAVVTSGHFACRLFTEDDRESIFRVYAPGDVFGRMAVGSIEAVRSMSIVALDDSAALELLPEHLGVLRAEHPQINDLLLAIAGLEMRRLAEQLVELMHVDADRRVRRRLLELATLFRDPVTGSAVIPLTQDEIGQLAGTSRVTVNRILREEESRGSVVTQRRAIALLDADLLAEAARWPANAVPPALRVT